MNANTDAYGHSLRRNIIEFVLVLLGEKGVCEEFGLSERDSTRGISLHVWHF